MKYKAKKSYKELPPEKNYISFGSGSKHIKLMSGEPVECDPPKELLEYLPEWMKENKTLAMGLLTLHYRTNMEGISLEKVKEKTNLDGENFTEIPGFAKTWDPNSIGTKSEGFWDGISKSDIS